jgi:ATPase subunit of ABC transporter with duplicated ATPase domains
MGSKTGESRTLVDMVEREWHMTLPNPIPLNTLGSHFQLRNASVGYTVDKKATTQSTPANTENMKIILKNITFNVEKNSKIGIVGKNGCGKSTLLKLIQEYEDELLHNASSPVLSSGTIYKANHLRVAYYQQHQQDSLPYEISSLQHMMNIAPVSSNNEQVLRAHLGSFGISGDLALRPIGTLSGGQKSRVVLAQLTINRSYMCFIDIYNILINSCFILTDLICYCLMNQQTIWISMALKR